MPRLGSNRLRRIARPRVERSLAWRFFCSRRGRSRRCSEVLAAGAPPPLLQPLRVLQLLLLLLGGSLWPAVANASLADCSRARSRLARSVVGTQLQPIYTARKLEIPAECPLSSQRDVYAPEQAAVHPFGTDGRLVCGICGKTVRSLDEADAHMATAHGDEFDLGLPNRVCLADFCDVLRCDAFAAAAAHQPSPADPAAQQCEPSRMAVLRERCESLLRTCVPAMYVRGERNGQTESSFAAAIVAAVCAPLTCDHYWQATAGGSGGVTRRQAVDPPHRALHYVVAGVTAVALLVVALMCFVNLLRGRGGPTEMQRFIKEVEDDEFVSSESGDGDGLRRRHVADLE